MQVRRTLCFLLTVMSGGLFLLSTLFVDSPSAWAEATTPLSTPVAMDKVSDPTTVIAGQPLTYTIQITNNTTGTLQNIVIRDPMPPGVATNGLSTITVINGRTPALQVSPAQITGTVASLNPGGMIFLTIHTFVSQGATGTELRNEAVVSAFSTAQTPYHNTASAKTALITSTPTATPPPTVTPTVTPSPPATTPATASPTATLTATHTPSPTASPTKTATPTATPTASPTATNTPTAVPNLADLQIEQSALPTRFVAGELLTYTLAITNHGPGIAYDLVIQDALPAGLHLEGASRMSMQGGETPKLALSQTAITGTAVSLVSGGTIRVAARTRVNAEYAGDELINEGAVTAHTPDPNPENNRVSLRIIRWDQKIDRTATLFLPLVQR